MKILMQPEKMFKNLVGKQKTGSSNYRRMKYTVTVEVDDNLLVYNTLSTELILLDNEEKKVFLEQVPMLKDCFNELVEGYFLVPNDFDEYKLYNEFFSAKKLFLNEKGINFYKILTTNDCNARCFYCYKLNAEHTYMSPETTEQLGKFILKNHTDKVHLYWFGGEPLMNTDSINRICEIMRENSIEYKSTLITNGYLFNDELVERAINKWKLNFVQITLDGTEKVHNRTKAFIYSNVNPYQVILGNIERLLKTGVTLRIRLNMDNYNKDDLYNLAFELKDKFACYKNFKVYTTLLFEKNSNRLIERSSDFRSKLVDEFLKFKDYLQSAGIMANIKLPNTMKINQCMADSSHSAVVLPDGRLARCDLDAEESVYGNIISEEKDISVLKEWTILRKEVPDCALCCLKPFCVEIGKCKERTMECDALEKKMKIYDIKASILDTYYFLTNK